MGDWQGDTLRLVEDNSMGPTRFTYTFSGADAYTLRVENSTDGPDWNLRFEESYQWTSA